MLAGRQLCLIAQRAMKQMTGYFGCYISKRQKMGKFDIKKSVAALPLMKEKLEHRNLKTASSQLAHVTNRMFSVVEGKGILRACTEEFMLSSQYKPHDPLVAEFIRTFRHQNFGGKWYLDRYDALCEKNNFRCEVAHAKARTWRRCCRSSIFVWIQEHCCEFILFITMGILPVVHTTSLATTHPKLSTLDEVHCYR